MGKEYQGTLLGQGLNVGVVVSRFNEFISSRLLDGTKDGLVRHGVDEGNIDIAWVPGAFEVPAIASAMARMGKYNAVICLGAVIRGETPHFDYVASEVSKGIAHVGLDTGVPVIYGVITADTLEQAIQRAGSKEGNTGFKAAMSAIEMANLLQDMKKA
ncbi:MAG: 6,7-dimethyl-8-ribityllumazine synthase [Dehalococcoidia bacterium]|nr:6,7-dimethyl-8-ribityllumazine synthase [Dehalococcoidia bacterium]